MNINQVSTNSFKAKIVVPPRKFVPLTEYKGPILKLTKSDINKIAELTETLTKLEIEYYDLNKYIRFAKVITRGLQDKMYFLENCIESLKLQIRDVKISRLNQQKLDGKAVKQ